MPRRILIALALALVAADGCNSAQCTPGEQRGCSRTIDASVTQSGFQLCGSTATWSACVPVGACRGAGVMDTVYGRCTDDDQCGPSGCAICSRYGGVANPSAFTLCMPFCQQDGDCAPPSPTRDTTARCVLGQCALFCHQTSRCPHATQCLAWDTDALRAANPGFDGLCE